MLDVGALLFTLAILSGVALMVVLIVRADRGNKKKVERWAKKQGWETANEDPMLEAQIRRLGITNRNPQWLTSVMRGQHASAPALSAEYRYEVEVPNKDGVTTKQEQPMHVVGLQLLASLPGIVVRPRGALKRTVQAVTGRRMETGDAAFDQAFNIERTQGEGALAVLNPEVRQYCLSTRKVPFAVIGDWMFTWKKGKPKSQVIEASLEQLAGLAAVLPQTPVGDDQPAPGGHPVPGVRPVPGVQPAPGVQPPTPDHRFGPGSSPE